MNTLLIGAALGLLMTLIDAPTWVGYTLMVSYVVVNYKLTSVKK